MILLLFSEIERNSQLLFVEIRNYGFELKTDIILMSESSSHQITQSEVAVKKVFTSQTIFKYISLFVTLILLFCIKGFLNYRDFCISKGIYVFAVDSFIWTLIGFILSFAFKYSWIYFMNNRMEKLVASKYVGEERVRKHRSMLKLSNDTIFYSIVTFVAYFYFRNEYWFPRMVGGCGSCEMIYKVYPNWPQNSRYQLQIYFMMQLGVHIFSLFEMVVIKRKTELKFYEIVLHHSVAVSLILFSCMSNQITPGAMILIIHDASDILMAFTRFYLETAGAKKMLGYISAAIMTIVWIWMRIIVFPFCLLANVYMNRPTEKDSWYMISFEYNYLLSMAIVLYGMHLFWTYFIIKITLKSIGKKNIENIHDKKEKM